MRMMITTKCKRRVRLIEQDLCEDQSMNMGADNIELYVRNHEVRTTGCPSVDYVLDVCYMWIAAELGEV